jgi:CBS domain-containing protein
MIRSRTPLDPAPLTLQAVTAADLMMPNPVSIPETAVVQEAITLLTDKGFSAAPVIDEAGRPVGVISRTDILVHDRECGGPSVPPPAYEDWVDLDHRLGRHVRTGFQVRDVDRTVVRDLMTPAVFCVAPDAPVREVIDQLVRLNVHRLFVVDDNGILVGVISARDIFRHLKP